MTDYRLGTIVESRRTLTSVNFEFVFVILRPYGIFSEVPMHLKQQVGFLIQFIVLTATPLISWWQLQFGFSLIWMPGLLTTAAILFWLGTWLREGK